MKMENNLKIINDVLKNLDWDLIMSFYSPEPADEYYVKKRGAKTQQLKPKSLMDIKKELRDLLSFVIQGGIRELHHDQWIIFWRSGEEGETRNNLSSRMEVVFVPTRSVSHGNNPIDKDDLHTAIDLDEIERDTLFTLLKKSIAEENYELCAVISSRLKKLNKTKPSKNGADI